MTERGSLSTVASGVNKLGEVSSTFAIWLPANVLNKYKKLPSWQRKLVRNAIKSFISELVENVDKVNVNVNVQNVILNVNMPVTMVKVEDTEDIELLKERIKVLEKDKAELKKLYNTCKEKAEKAEELEAELKKTKEELEKSKRLTEFYRRKSRGLEQAIKYFLEGHLSFEEFKKMFERSGPPSPPAVPLEWENL